MRSKGQRPQRVRSKKGFVAIYFFRQEDMGEKAQWGLRLRRHDEEALDPCAIE